MNATKLQIPVKTNLKDKAEKIAKKQGFSSLQEVIRVFLAGYVEGKFSPTFVNTNPVGLNPDAEERLWRIKEDLEKEIVDNTAFTAKDGDDLLNQLKSMK